MKKIKGILKKISNYLKIKEPVYLSIYHSELLNSRCALITGGTNGIGLEIAKAFLNSGATVIITSRSKEKVEKVVDDIIKKEKRFLNKIYGVNLDLTDINSINEGFLKIKKISSSINKKVDILVNNAGVSGFPTFGNVSEKEFDLIVNTNLKGTYFLTQLIYNDMIKFNISGNILNILSSSSVRPALNPYMISKWGELGFTLGLAKKAIENNIVVNGIAPGPTATNMINQDNDNLNYYKNPSGRYVSPTEIGNLAVFMVSNMGRMIVGDTVYITGGAGIITYDDIKY